MSAAFKNAETRDTPPFRADIVGSFLRPQAIKEARAKFKNDEISAGDLCIIEDMEIAKLVKKEKEIGLKAVTDGEFRRSWWHLDFMWGFDGVEKRLIEEGYQFNDLETRAETAQLTGKISCSNHPMVAHYKFLKSIAGDNVITRQTIPAPAQFFAELQRGENIAFTDSIYRNTDELISDIVSAYRTVINALYAAGCRNLQLDDFIWGMFCGKAFRESRQRNIASADETLRLYARINNEAINGHPSDMVVTMNVCRGNYSSTWASSGDYEPIAEILFGTVNVDGFYLEFDTDRAGDFKPLRFIKDKQVVLGLISSKTSELENKEDIKKRIEEATQYIDINRICLSPQCGFASTEEGNILTEEQQWDKLRLVKEIADEILG